MDDNDHIEPPEGTDRKYRVTDDNKLEEREDEEAEFAELNFEE